MQVATSGFADRLRQLIGPDSVRSFAREVGVGSTTLQKYLDGTVPGLDKAAQIAGAKSVSLEWLATGTGPMRHGQSQSQMIVSGDVPAGFIPVPKLDIRPSAGAGTLVTYEESEAEIYGIKEQFLRRMGVSPRAARLMVAKGDSMFDTISDGDLMIVDVSIREVVEEAIYVLVYAGLVVVKRIKLLRNGGVVLKSDNERYGSEEVSAAELPELIVEGRVRWAGGMI